MVWGGAPHVDLLTRLENAIEECEERPEDRIKFDKTYRRLIVDVMMELDVTFRQFNRTCGLAFQRQLIEGTCARQMRALVYKSMKIEIQKKRK